jgi:hypothetical protein
VISNEDKVREIFDRHVLKGEIVEAYALPMMEGDSFNPASEKVLKLTFRFSNIRPSGPSETKA